MLNKMGLRSLESTAEKLWKLLSLRPGEQGFGEAVALAGAVDDKATEFWRDVD